MNLQEKQQQLRGLIPVNMELERKLRNIPGALKNVINPYVPLITPQLNDLLRALPMRYKLWGETLCVCINEKELLSAEGWDEVSYNLTADPLSQDEETTDKLIELLS